MLEIFIKVCQCATGVVAMCTFTIGAIVLLKKFVFISKGKKHANDLKKLKKLQDRVNKHEGK